MVLQRSFAVLLAVLVLLSSVPTGTVRAEAPDPAASSPTIAPLPAVNTGDTRFGMVQSIAAADLAFQAGSRWDRVIFPWSLIQKDGPNSWAEHYYTDEAIKAQVRRGVTMTGVMIYTPQWASVTPTTGRPVDKPQGLDLPYNDPRNTWGQFVRKLAARHKGTVDHWYVWNEPDLFSPALRYTWDSSYEDYAKLLKVAYLNIKEVNPDAKVILGGLTYWMDRK